ncbi:extracellular membrane 8-cysteine cfem [Fusarium longipes]|uniref:Extracellular membrane 8-cysteine cfem n=1 Tax=Fusarium longipes TaxID=694270 RepID=A0A395T1F0_9HYPO|nr:extracellular membrane 8-cysteine cfem [Fusarium longipes]
MKYSVALVAIAAVAAQAQSLADVPKCALPCLDKAIESETSCETTDTACVCENFSAIRGVATSCVIDACGTDVAINKVLPATEALCKNPPKAEPKPSTKEEEKPASTKEEEKPSTTKAAVYSTVAAPAETSAAEEPTTVAPIIPTTPTAVGTPSTPAATPSDEPTQVNSAAGLKGLGALAMAAFAVLAL